MCFGVLAKIYYIFAGEECATQGMKYIIRSII